MLSAYGQHSWNQYTGFGPPDVHRMVWTRGCIRFDVAPGPRNFEIDLADAQAVAQRYGLVWFHVGYEQRFDTEPATNGYFGHYDGDIDALDKQKIFGRVGMKCP